MEESGKNARSAFSSRGQKKKKEKTRQGESAAPPIRSTTLFTWRYSEKLYHFLFFFPTEVKRRKRKGKPVLQQQQQQVDVDERFHLNIIFVFCFFSFSQRNATVASPGG